MIQHYWSLERSLLNSQNFKKVVILFFYTFPNGYQKLPYEYKEELHQDQDTEWEEMGDLLSEQYAHAIRREL